VITFRPDNDIFEGMRSLRDRDGVPFSEQIRRSLRMWLETKAVMQTTPRKDRVAHKRARSREGRK
jgi:hypothetical protein